VNVLSDDDDLSGSDSVLGPVHSWIHLMTKFTEAYVDFVPDCCHLLSACLQELPRNVEDSVQTALVHALGSYILNHPEAAIHLDVLIQPAYIKADTYLTIRKCLQHAINVSPVLVDAVVGWLENGGQSV